MEAQAGMTPNPIRVTPAQARRLERNVRKSGGALEFRPDLSDYRIYIELLADKLNEDALYSISLTDAVKICIEKALEKVVPDVVVNKKRKKYIQKEGK